MNPLEQAYLIISAQTRAGQVRAFSSTSTDPLSTSIDSLTTSMGTSTSTSTNTIV